MRHRRGGPLALLRFMRANRMLSSNYALLLTRYVLLKLRYGKRLQTDGLCFICPRVKLEIEPVMDRVHPLRVEAEQGNKLRSDRLRRRDQLLRELGFLSRRVGEVLNPRRLTW